MQEPAEELAEASRPVMTSRIRMMWRRIRDTESDDPSIENLTYCWREKSAEGVARKAFCRVRCLLRSRRRLLDGGVAVTDAAGLALLA
ncbi:MAG: hypothetical protein OXG25_06490 [Gammaproteobacteria bacterium]|nr:hypothetical protein [Gammaproteobacteria bacterium]